MDFRPGCSAAPATTDVAQAAPAVAAGPSLFPGEPGAASPVVVPVPRWHRAMSSRAAAPPGGSADLSSFPPHSGGLPTTAAEGTAVGGSGAKFDYMIVLYSGAAACTADAVAFPFDTAKTR